MNFEEIMELACVNTTTPTTQTTTATTSSSTTGPTSSTTSTTTCGNVAEPTFSPAHGSVVTFPVSVTLASTEPGGAIRYTKDGSTPNGNSTLYTAPVLVENDTTVLKAITVAAGCKCFSDVVGASYVGSTTSTTTGA